MRINIFKVKNPTDNTYDYWVTTADPALFKDGTPEVMEAYNGTEYTTLDVSSQYCENITDTLNPKITEVTYGFVLPASEQQMVPEVYRQLQLICMEPFNVIESGDVDNAIERFKDGKHGLADTAYPRLDLDEDSDNTSVGLIIAARPFEDVSQQIVKVDREDAELIQINIVLTVLTFDTLLNRKAGYPDDDENVDWANKMQKHIRFISEEDDRRPNGRTFCFQFFTIKEMRTLQNAIDEYRQTQQTDALHDANK